jgi:hypothetical protein
MAEQAERTTRNAPSVGDVVSTAPLLSSGAHTGDTTSRSTNDG